MMTNIEEITGEAIVWVMIASRILSPLEQQEVRAILDAWIKDWSYAFPECPIAQSQSLFEGRAFSWAVDCEPRKRAGRGPSDLSGSDLDPLYHSLEAFSMGQSPPFKVLPDMALIVGDKFVTLGPQWQQLAQEGVVTAETPLVRSCSVSQWRAGWLVHRLGDEDPDFVAKVGTIQPKAG